MNPKSTFYGSLFSGQQLRMDKRSIKRSPRSGGRLPASFYCFTVKLYGLIVILSFAFLVSQPLVSALKLSHKSSSSFAGQRHDNVFDWDDIDAITRTERSFGNFDGLHGFEPPSRPNIHWDNPHYKPYFDSTVKDRNVTAQLGKSTFLKCKIKQVTDETVSWVRQRDLHIISAGDYIYTSDQRFKPKHVDNTDEWYLHIEYVQKEDVGIYECQVSTEPKMSLSFYLNVIEAKSEILGGPIMYVQSRSTINLTCIINQTASPPMFVYWHQDEKVLSFRDSDPGNNHQRLKVTTAKGPITVSTLEIRKAKSTDSGNYSCRPVPQYADPANITVHVLNGENPAAMQHSNHKGTSLASNSLTLTVFSLLIVKRIWINHLN